MLLLYLNIYWNVNQKQKYMAAATAAGNLISRAPWDNWPRWACVHALSLPQTAKWIKQTFQINEHVIIVKEDYDM